jgi:hypothetical protein
MTTQKATIDLFCHRENLSSVLVYFVTIYLLMSIS